MKLYPKPENLDINVPKHNREVELNVNFQKNDKYVNTKEKQLYNTQNYVQKTISILAGLGQNLLDDSDSLQGGAVNHKDTVQKCLHAVTLLGHVQAEMSQKRRNNIRLIVNYNYASLCGPQPGSQAAKKKPRNQKSEYLLGDSFKNDAKMAKAATDMFRKSVSSSGSNDRIPKHRDSATQKNQFLDNERKGRWQHKVTETICRQLHKKQQQKSIQDKRQITQEVSVMQAGNIKNHSQSWRQITQDQYILDIVENGLKLNFDDIPSNVPFEHKLSTRDTDIISGEINKLLQKGVITKSTYKENDFFSSFFVRPKKDGNFRTILNLKQLNLECDTYHFKMESMKQLLI